MTLGILGPHDITGTPDALYWAARANVAKAMGATGAIRSMRNSPDVVGIYRWPFAGPAQDNILDQARTDPRAAAARVVGYVVGGLGGFRMPRLYAELLNEVGKGRRAEYVALCTEAVPMLHAAGLLAAGPSFATGDFEQADWDAFRVCGFDAYALHAYWSTAGFTPWNALRWRTYWQPGDPLVLVTECGRDRVRDGNPQVNDGWLPLDNSGSYGWQAASQNCSADQYLAELRAYDAELKGDPRVIGGVAFTTSPTDDWRAKGFDTDSLARQLADETIPFPPRLSQPSMAAPNEGVNGSPAGEPIEADVGDTAVPSHEEMVAFARERAVANDLLPDLFVQQITQESGWNPKAVSRAGAKGLGQFMPLWWENGEFDPFDPWESLTRSAAWMGALTRQYGDAIRPLLEYNGGSGAVAAYAEGKPWSESTQYIRAVLGNLCIRQFEENGEPSLRLQANGFPTAGVRSACAPIALAGLAMSLGLPLTPEGALRAAPAHGWTLEGMNGPTNFGRLAAAHGMTISWVPESNVRSELYRGRCVVISTPKHYYLAQWPSRVDDDLYVGFTGLARIGGHEWMSLAEIHALDGGINGLMIAERAPVPEPVVVDPIEDALSNLHDLTLTAGPHDEARRVSAQAALNVIKEAVLA